MCLSYKNGEKIIKFNKNLSLGHKKKSQKLPNTLMQLFFCIRTVLCTVSPR